jgi:hypothetical protein
MIPTLNSSEQPTLHLTPFFHGNLQYAEFHPDSVPDIVEQSYLPTLRYFADRPEFKAVFEYSGVSLEWMAARWPETIDLLRRMLQRGQIELLGSTYADPILPLIPLSHARRHLARFSAIYNELFGDLKGPAPEGVFLQEFAYDPALAPLLRAAGYRYTILTPRLLLAGTNGQLNVALKPLKNSRPDLPSALGELPAHMGELRDNAAELLYPVQMLGAQGASITAFPLYRELIDLLFEYARGRPVFEQLAGLLLGVAAGNGRFPPLLFFGPSDHEFIAQYSRVRREAIPIEVYGDLLGRLQALPFVCLDLPGRYLRDHPAERHVYVPAGTSEQAFDLWQTDADNMRLNALCDEAARKLEMASLCTASDDPRVDDAWQAMMLAENSDGRGWLPCPERRLACYDQALRAIALADEMLVEGWQRPFTQPIIPAAPHPLELVEQMLHMPHTAVQ